jgi:integrase
MPLTDMKCKNAKPRKRTVRLYDQRGLYLEVSPSGGHWWRLKYRFEGREKRLSLGVYPDVNLKKARARCDDARRLVAEGIDPSQHRKAEKAAAVAHAEADKNTFEAVAREWFDKQSEVLNPDHAKRVLRLFERDLFPFIGRCPIAEIEAPKLLTVLQQIEARGVRMTTHRARIYSGKVFQFAIAAGKAKRNPAADLKGALAPMPKEKHFPAVTEPKQFGDLLRTLDGYQGTFAVRCALRLAPLLAVRPGELRKAKWADFDLNKAEWRFVASKTAPDHLVPLCTQAVTILSDLQRLTGNGEYLFPSARSAKRPMSDNAVLAALRRLEIPADSATGHGFRASFRTIGDEVLKFRVDLMEHQLAHEVKDANGRAYNRTAFLPERKRMMQRWADYCDRIKAGADAEVIEMKRA